MRPFHRAGVLAVTASLLLGVPAAHAQSGDATISGRVTEGTDGLAGVCVQAFDVVLGTEVGSTRTDAAGDYAITGLPAGSYVVGFNTCEQPLAGYALEYWRSVPSAIDAEPIDLEAGATATAIDADLEPAGTIAGTVAEEGSGDPIAGACVAAIDLGTEALSLTRTDASGDYALSNLRASAAPDGGYLVYVGDCTEPYTHVWEYVDDIGPGSTGDPTVFTVQAGQTVSGVDAALTLGGALTGTVTAAHTGREVPFVCVALWQPTADASAPELFDYVFTGVGPLGTELTLDGTLIADGLPAGDYLVEFDSEVCGEDSFASEWWRDAAAPAQAQRITVTAGNTTTGIDAVLLATPSIELACPEEVVVEDGFGDVPERNVHEFAIDCIVTYGIASGRADGTYGPASPVRRDQMATFIANALQAAGVTLPSDPPDAFRDDDGNVHEASIDALAALGVVGGTGAGRYSPDATVSRAQMATFLVNAYEFATGFDLRSVGDAFADDEGSVHEANIDRAHTAGIVAGTSATTYAPAQVVRRDQMASFLARLLDRVVRDTVVEGSSSGGASASAAAVRAAAVPRGR